MSTGLLTLSLIVWTGLLSLLAFLLTRETQQQAISALMIALVAGLSLKWCYIDGLVQRVMDNTHAAPPLFNLFVLNGLLLMAAVLLNRTIRQTERGAVAGWWIGILVFTAINIETLRSVDYWMAGTASLAGIGNAWIIKNVALSVLWGSIGFASVIVGFMRRIAPVRWVALGLLGVTVAKVLLVDMAQVDTMLRILSFLVVGGLLLLVSFVYHKVARQSATRAAANGPS